MGDREPNRISKLGAVVVVAAALALVAGVAAASAGEAYVTLLYGDEFLLGVRVLGKSIRDSGSTKDMVVLVSDGVSDHAINLLKADGWIVDMISLLANPNQVRPTRFWGVYTKLKIFNMTDYRKVVYLDADTIVVKNIDNLFQCGKFCANLKHSERLNSGVMVVEPSAAVFNDMMTKVTTLPSYTGGDQGFLNSYYADFPNAHVFQPNLPKEVLKSRPVPKMERLSTLYNADVGLYMLANKWMVDESELHVIHYTLGPLKPWDWWTSWLVKPVDVWQRVRVQLEESLPGTGGGRNPSDELIVKFLFFVPLCALLFIYYRYHPQLARTLCRSSFFDQARQLYNRVRTSGGFGYTGVPPSSVITSPHKFYNGALSKVPGYLGAASIITCLLAALVAIAVSFSIVPRQVTPWTGMVLMYEWTFAIFSLLFGGFLQLMYLWGKTAAVQVGSPTSHSESSDYDSEKVHQKPGLNCGFSTWHYWFGMAALAVAVPSLPFICGISALFIRLGLMVAVGMILVSFMTYASEHLATGYFLKGLEDRDSTRTRSSFFC